VYETDPNLHPVDEDEVDMHWNKAPPLPPLIQCTVQMVPVTYAGVLERVPGFHARPPVIMQEEGLPWIPPPEDGYDVFLHVGVAGRGPLRMERLGHKLGYRMKDASGHLAPVYVPSSKKPEDAGSPKSHPGADSPPVGISRGLPSPSDAEMRERELYPAAVVDAPMGVEKPPIRGFGEGYERFPNEIETGIDVEQLCKYVKQSNPKV
jgi:pyroglutamyl-peptidase